MRASAVSSRSRCSSSSCSSPVGGSLEEEILLAARAGAGLQRPADLRQPSLQPDHVLARTGGIVGLRQARQRCTEPCPHLVVREAHGEDAHELVSRLCASSITSRRAAASRSACQWRGWRSTRCSCRRSGPQRGLLGARRTDSRRPGPRGRRHMPVRGRRRGRPDSARTGSCRGPSPAGVGAELALVLVLQHASARSAGRRPAPAGQRHGDVALADARRGLDEEHPGRGGRPRPRPARRRARRAAAPVRGAG